MSTTDYADYRGFVDRMNSCYGDGVRSVLRPGTRRQRSASEDLILIRWTSSGADRTEADERNYIDYVGPIREPPEGNGAQHEVVFLRKGRIMQLIEQASIRKAERCAFNDHDKPALMAAVADYKLYL